MPATISVPNKQRHLGMDIVRFIAIISVLISHGLVFFYPYYNIESLIYLAVFGVELFFALSGFLIGNLLIRLNRQNQSLRNTMVFWFRRWMRTIPAYLVIASIVMLVKKEFFLSYFAFVQNMYPDQLKNFPVSWTLSIEEWFYLLFPLLMLFFSHAFRLFNIKNIDAIVVITSIVCVLLPLMLRFNTIGSDLLWDDGVRKQIPLRLDGIVYGVILALIYDKNPQWFNHNHLSVLSPIGLVILFSGVWWIYNISINIFNSQPTIFNTVIFYPLINILSTFIVAYFIRFLSCQSLLISKPIQFISVISYSLYLVHFPIYIWCSEHANSLVSAWIYFLISLVIILASALILYFIVERPFMLWRDRWTNKLVKQKSM